VISKHPHVSALQQYDFFVIFSVGPTSTYNYLMPNSQDIALKRITVEAAVIVASILLAFAIDAWWDERQERTEETEILLGLKSEFSRYRDDLEKSIEYHAVSRLLTEELMAATRRGVWGSESLSIDNALVSLSDPKSLDFGGGVLDALISAGRLEIISDSALRMKLASWREVFNEIRDDEIRSQNFSANQVIPYMLRWHIPQGRGLDLCCSWNKWPQSTRSIEDDPGALSRLLGDPEFEILLDLRFADISHITLEHETALQSLDEILDAIGDSLSELQ